ncbi:hypothetical protein TNCV_4471431 [Trichonephila clavipes]|uniref:Uncharacterized protein n=1 Tax=Trichonephila clavipes TaxID=2585209 RepID=A0A8X6SLB1_TRICX|nr:hypothetical protein TNCV_4471431 [Trichonephila clavipes]
MTNKKLVMGRIDRSKGSLKSIGKPLVRKVRGCRSRQGNTTREIPRNKRKMSDKESKDQVLKRSKICRKRSLQGSEHQDRKRRAPEQRQGANRSIPSSISSRTYKFKRPNTSSPGVESIAGPSRFPDRKRTVSTEDPERKVVDVMTKPARPERQREDATNKRRNQSGQVKPLHGDLAHTIYEAD